MGHKMFCIVSFGWGNPLQKFHCTYVIPIVIDCGIPSQPRNGVVTGNDFTFGATVEYHCINGFVLVGLKTRTCQEDGSWSGDRPLCKGKMETIKLYLYSS